MKQTDLKYTPWKPGLICQRPTIGSAWYLGNFSLGLQIDSHPRFVNIILALLFVEIGISFQREAIVYHCGTCGNTTITEVPTCDCERTPEPTDISVRAW